MKYFLYISFLILFFLPAALISRTAKLFMTEVNHTFRQHPRIRAQFKKEIKTDFTISYHHLLLKLHEGRKKKVPPQQLSGVIFGVLRYYNTYYGFLHKHRFHKQIQILLKKNIVYSYLTDLSIYRVPASNILNLLKSMIAQKNFPVERFLSILKKIVYLRSIGMDTKSCMSIMHSFIRVPAKTAMFTYMEFYFSYALMQKIPLKTAARVLTNMKRAYSKRRMINILNDNL